MIKLEFDKPALYQWDLNMRIELENIPAGVEVHYSDNQNTQNECPVLLSYEEDGKVYANIPNIYLQKSGIISVYIYVKENNKGYTKHYSEIFVLPRKKPSDYVYTETEVKSYETLEKRISVLEKGGVSDEKIESVIKDYLEENPVETGATKEQAEQIEKNKQDIGKLSEQKADKDFVISVFEQLKQLIQNGETDSAVALLDSAILDLSTLA